MQLAGFTVLVGSVLAVACSRPHAVPSERANPDAGAVAVHPTGLVLGPQPATFKVSETAAGYRIEPVDARWMRRPWSIQVGLADVQPAASAGGQSKKVGDREAQFRVTVDEEAGSGGPLHTLTAWLPCRDRGIAMTASQQVEPPAKPDWSTAWAVLQAGQCRPAPHR